MTRRSSGEGTLYRRADGRWEGAAYVLSVSGRRRVRVYGFTRAEAREKLVERLAQSGRGVPVPDRDWRVGAYLDYWLENVVAAKNRPKTRDLYESTIRLQLNPLLGSKSLRMLSVRQVQEAFNVLLRSGASIRTVHKVRTVLSSALGRAMREEIVFRNVARLVELPTWERKDITPWTLDQASAFLRVSAAHRWSLGYLLLLTYGMRRGEVLGLTWEDIDLERGVIHVRRQLQRIDSVLVRVPVKTSAGKRDLPIVSSARQALEHARGQVPGGPDPSAHIVLSSTGTPVDPKNFVRAFYDLVELAALPRITMHHTRHTAATLLKYLGVDARDAQLILGHANVTTTQMLYQHGDVELQRLALERVDSALTAGHAPIGVPTSTPSRPAAVSDTTTSARAQGANETADAPLTEVGGDTNMQILGGPGGDRTLDILLKSHLELVFSSHSTPVITHSLTATRRRIMGLVAVNFSRQTQWTYPDRAHMLAGLKLALEAVLADRCRRQRPPFTQ